MRSVIKPAVLATIAVAASLQVQAAAPSSPQGIITAREFLDIGGTALADLTGSSKFPGSPDINAYSPRFEWPTGPDEATPPAGDVKNNYGVQILGYFYPPTTGDYVFYLAADDNAALYLSTDDNPANKKEIATEPEWNPVRAFSSTARRDNHLRPDGTLPNISAPIRLTQGRAYYIEGLMKEGGGGDNLAVAVQGPNDSAPEDGGLPIPGSRLSSFDRPDLAPPYVAGFASGASGVTWTIEDGTGTPVDPNTVKVQIDGTDRTATVSKSGKTTTAKVTVSPFFAAGSTHTSKVTAGALTAEKSFKLGNYITLTAAMKVTADTTKPGFSVLVHQVSTGQGNTNQRAEEQLAGLLKDADGNPLPNIADLSGAGPDGRFVETGVINYSQSEGENNGAFTPDLQMPGIPGTEGGTDNIAMEIITYLQLPAGEVTMGVNSDDGFRTTAGNVRDALGALRLGEFDGGRGAADTIFSFIVEEAGVYPFRTIWEEGGGGANIEWFTVNNGTKVLVNGTEAGAVKGFRASSSPVPPAIKLVSPASNASNIAVDTAISAQIVDGGAKVDAASVKMTLDGAPVTATVNKAGDTTTVSYKPAAALKAFTKYTVGLSYTDNAGGSRDASWSFTTLIPIDAVKGGLFIEAEDFNFDGGKWIENKPIGMTGKYPGGDYLELGTEADAGIDYNNPGGNAGQTYRPGTGVAAGKQNAHPDGLPRGDFDVEVNHVVGWNDSGDWQNYTRRFPEPAKKYNVYARISSGGANINAELARVTSDPTKPGQTTQPLAISRPGRATAGWDNMEIFQLTNTEGTAPAVVELGGLTTLRWTTLPGNHDVDWIAFVEAKDVPSEQPKFTSIKISGSNVVVEWTGAGTVQQAAAVTGPWTDVPGAKSPATVPIAGAGTFWRIKQ